MAFSTWIQAEQFYNRTVMWIALGSIVIIFIGLFIVFYAERKKAVLHWGFDHLSSSVRILDVRTTSKVCFLYKGIQLDQSTNQRPTS